MSMSKVVCLYDEVTMHNMQGHFPSLSQALFTIDRQCRVGNWKVVLVYGRVLVTCNVVSTPCIFQPQDKSHLYVICSRVA